MKIQNLNKMLLTALVALSFTTDVQAEKFKLKMCERAEVSFWDTVNNAYATGDHSFVASLGREDQIAYFNLAKGKIEESIAEVRKRCKTMDKDVTAAYESKQSELNTELGKLMQ